LVSKPASLEAIVIVWFLEKPPFAMMSSRSPLNPESLAQ
jgi:hypothetical protein